MPHPPYSPDLAPSDFFLFPKLKEHLKKSVSIALMKQNTQQKLGLEISVQNFSKMVQMDESTAWGSASTVTEVMLKNKFIVNRNQ